MNGEARKFRVLVAPAGFKGGLGGEAVAGAIARGIRRVSADVEAIEFPVVDGGEGFTEAVVSAAGGQLHAVRVTGPTGAPVPSFWGSFTRDGIVTGVVEMAAAAGLRLVPEDRRDPLATTTFGVGELIRHALDGGARRLIVGCGDSGTNDGGAGMLAALGFRLLDAAGAQIGPGGGGVATLDRIDATGCDPRLAGMPVTAACNIANVLCGPRGVARVFGPQKGASAADVDRLAAAMDLLAAILQRDLGADVRTLAGAGASGGLGAALHAGLGAELVSCYDVLAGYYDLDSRLAEADLVITAEGGLDRGTATGKIPAEIGRRARRLGIPVLVLAGAVGEEARSVYDHGVDAFFSIVGGPCTLDEAIAKTTAHLESCAENVMRAVMAGSQIERAAASARLAGE